MCILLYASGCAGTASPTSATAIKTDATGNFEVIFTYATSVDFGALVTAPSNTVTITTKKDATLDLGSWLSQDASGNKVDATIALNGPASFTNGTAAGTFASTGLGGNTLGAHTQSKIDAQPSSDTAKK